MLSHLLLAAILVIAHRGAHQRHPENTLAAFQEALRLGCDYIEVDVRTTSGGVLVIRHDDTKPTLRATTFETLHTREPHVPTFPQVLAFAKDHIGIYVDVKQAAAQPLADAIQQAGMTTQVVIYAKPELLQEIHTRAPEIKVMPEAVSLDVLRKNLATLKPKVIAFSDWNWQDPIIAMAREAMAEIFVDRLDKSDTPEAWDDAIHRGATGIQTNKPAELLEYLKNKSLR